MLRISDGIGFDTEAHAVAYCIESVTADDEPVRYFLINGTEVKDASIPGFYIVRKGDKVNKLRIEN